MKKGNYSKISSCNHTSKVRVIEMGDKCIKVFVGKYVLNRLSIMTDSAKKSFL